MYFAFQKWNFMLTFQHKKFFHRHKTVENRGENGGLTLDGRIANRAGRGPGTLPKKKTENIFICGNV